MTAHQRQFYHAQDDMNNSVKNSSVRMNSCSRRRARCLVVTSILAALVVSPSLARAQSLSGSASGISPSLSSGAAVLSQDNTRGPGFISKRRSLGAVFIASGVLLAMQGFDYKDEADSFYDAYELATDAAEIEKFYQRTTNRDVKSQVTWALAAAFGVTGLRLVLTGGSSATETTRSKAMTQRPTIQQPLISLVPAVTTRTVGLQLQRHFH